MIRRRLSGSDEGERNDFSLLKLGQFILTDNLLFSEKKRNLLIFLH